MKSLMRISLIAGLTLALALAAVACGGDDDSDGGGSSGGELEGANVAFLPKEIDNPYFDVAAEGGESAASELGGEFKQVGPSQASAPEQVPFINTLTQQDVDAIAVSANDPDALVPTLERAASQDVAIVTYDSDVAPEARSLFINQADSEEIGRSQVQMIAEQIDNE